MSFNLRSILSFSESDMGDSRTFSGTSVSDGIFHKPTSCLVDASDYKFELWSSGSGRFRGEGQPVSSLMTRVKNFDVNKIVLGATFTMNKTLEDLVDALFYKASRDLLEKVEEQRLVGLELLQQSKDCVWEKSFAKSLSFLSSRKSAKAFEKEVDDFFSSKSVLGIIKFLKDMSEALLLLLLDFHTSNSLFEKVEIIAMLVRVKDAIDTNYKAANNLLIKRIEICVGLMQTAFKIQRYVAIKSVNLAIKQNAAVNAISQEDFEKVERAEKAKQADTIRNKLLAQLDREEAFRKRRVPTVVGQNTIPASPKEIKTEERDEVKFPAPSAEKAAKREKIARLLALYKGGIPIKVHERLLRWEKATPEVVRRFQDQPGLGQIPYSEMKGEQCLDEIACHRLLGVLLLLKKPFKSRYLYPYTYPHPETGERRPGLGVYAEMTRGGEVKAGVITIGIGEDKVAFHLHFKAFNGRPRSGLDLVETLDQPASSCSSEVKWEGASPYRFDEEAKGVLKMVVHEGSEGSAIFRLYPIDYQ